MYGSNCQNIILININTSLELMISRDTDMFNLINMFSRHPIMECRIFVSLYDKYGHTFQFRTAQKTMRENPLNQTYFVTIQPPYLKYKRLVWLAEIAKETANLRKSTQAACPSVMLYLRA